MELAVTAEDVEAAAAAIAGAVVRTPTVRSKTLSDITGADVSVKFENLQFTASFKERGALNRCLHLTDSERQRGVAAMSAGNFSQALAYHAGRLGIPATIVMPTDTPFIKVSRTRRLGARVVLEGSGLEEAAARTAELAEEAGMIVFSPFDDDAVIAGQGTVALEMLEDLPDVETLVVPVGGGGLIAGMAVAARALRPHIEIVGVQSEAFPSMVAALQGTEAHCGGSTIADGIAVPHPGELTRPIVAALVDDVVTVPEARIEEAVCLYLEVEKTVAEGAGAVSLAALLERPARFSGKRCGLVLSGGNIDLRLLASVIMRGLVRSGRLTRLHIEMPDTPGSLTRATEIMGRLRANIVEVWHQRDVLGVPSRSADVEVLVETADRDHTQRLIDGLREVGFTTRSSTPGGS